MSKKVGILRAILRLDGSQFDKDTKQHKSKITRFASFAKRAFAPLAAAAAAIGSARAVKQTLDMVDAQAKLARSLGTTVESMQVLARAGELAGVGQAQLEQGAKDLFRRLSQASAKGGPAAEALDRLKLSAGDLVKLPLDDRISKINRALEDHVPAAERAAVAGALFGEEGAIAMTRLDPATLRQASEEVAKFGRAISDVEAAKIEQANDALSRVGLFVKGIGTDLTIALAPVLNKIADGLSSMAGAWRVIWSIVQDVVYFAVEIWKSFHQLRMQVTGMGEAWPKITKAVGNFFVGVKKLLSGLRAVSELSGGISKVWQLLQGIGSEISGRIAAAFRSMGLEIKATFIRAAGNIKVSLANILRGATDWAAKFTDIGVGAKDAFVAAFKALPSSLGSLMYQAANTAISGVESMINGVIKRINKFITSINNAITSLPDWARGGFNGIATVGDVSLGGVQNPYANAPGVGRAVVSAFRSAQSQTDFGPIGEELKEAGEALRKEAAGIKDEARELLDGFDAPLDSVKELWTAIDDAKTAQEEAAKETDNLNNDLTELDSTSRKAASSLGGGGGSVAKIAKKATDKLKTLRDGVKGLSDELAGAAMQGRSWGEVLTGAIRKVAQNWLSQGIENILFRMAGLSGGGRGNFFGSLLGGLFGARAQGGGVRAGQIYQVNENTPRSEWMFTSGNGGVLNHGQMTSAVNQAIGGGTKRGGAGSLRISLSDGLKAELLNEAARNSVEITQSGLESANLSMIQSQRRD